MTTSRKGLLVVLDGPDGVGKTTLAQGLKACITHEGLPVLLTREPGGTALGREVRRLVLDREAGLDIAPRAELLLFAADRAQHVARVIQPALDNGQVVLCDRWHLSTWAYQHIGRGLPLDTVAEACALASGGVQADISIVLKASPAGLAHRRTGRGDALDRMESAGNGFHARIADAYAVAGTLAPPSLLGKKTLGFQTDDKSTQAVLAEVWRALAPLLR